ncbi:MAG: hypothetical protein Q9173_001357 [Seirophora scorigena]
MACDQANSNIENSRRQPPVLKDQGKRPQGIKEQQAVRKSLRLQAIRQSHKQFSSKRDYIQEVQAPLSPPASNIPEGRKATRRPQTLHKPSTSSRKWKRGQEQEVGHPSSRSQEQSPLKRLQTLPSNCINKKESYQAPASDVSEGSIDPLQHWIQAGKWRKEYFEQDSQVREDFERGKSPEEPGRRDWLQEYFNKEPSREMQALTHPHHFFVRPPLSRKESQSLKTPSDQPSQGGKSSQYNNPEYEIRLEQKGSYMRKSPLGITDTSRELCRSLLEKEQSIPQNTLFRDDLFDETCESVQGRNEAMIVRDITPLICPSAQVLRIHGARHLNLLYESVNEAWSNMNSYEGTLPQPDYSVGFGRSAFTEEQLDKLKPFVGKPGFKVITHFMATTRIYFPFFTCEVKCGAAALDFADRKNAQSMSVALRAFVVLFRYVKREKELDREILTFSVSHDHRSVRIYGHHPVIEGDKTTFYRHPIHVFDFTALDGREKWTALKFVKNVYDHHSPKVHKLICSAIDDLPAGINFDLSQSASFSQSTPQSLQQSNAESVPGEDDSQSSFLASQEVTPTTSFTQATEPAFKKPRNKRASEQQR